ncbi:hypothetical protein YC2023_112165 [Brassica napus]
MGFRTVPSGLRVGSSILSPSVTDSHLIPSIRKLLITIFFMTVFGTKSEKEKQVKSSEEKKFQYIKIRFCLQSVPNKYRSVTKT